MDWFGATRSARARILASYIILLALSAVVLTVALRQILIIRVDARTQAALQQEVLEFDRLLADGRDPETGQPFGSLRSVFDVYFARNVPSHEEALLAFWDGALYRSNLSRFPVTELPPAVLSDWEAFSSRLPATDAGISGRFQTERGEARFQASRLWFGGNPGAFVVAILPAGELAGVAELQTYGIFASLAVLLVASLLAWLIVGRALRPVRLLTETARSISQSDLTRRIEVRGSDEAAVMASSFNAMLDRLETVFGAQREFIEDASHELRDPLTICRGQLELIDQDPAERDRTIALVLDEIDRMGRIVDELQLLAEAEQPDFLRLGPIEVEPFVRDLIAKASSLAPRHWQVDEVEPGTVLADRHLLTEAVMNLASNAVHHTQANDTIAIGAAVGVDDVRLWVRDTGTGITISDQTRIFGRFSRGRGANQRYRGSGLGLAIVRAIAEAHGGQVELESRLGAGSTFTLVMPARTQAMGQDDAENPDR
jgi:signal transduction histidine kinase